jgi:hypothetical protein
MFDVESEDWSSNVVLFYDHASGYSVLLMSKANDGGKVAKCDVVATVDVDAVFFVSAVQTINFERSVKPAQTASRLTFCSTKRHGMRTSTDARIR